MRKLMTVVKCVAALAAGMFMFGANAGTQLYPASGTQDYGEVSSDINQKVDLPNTVSVAGAYVRCTFEGFATKPCRLQGLKPYSGGAEIKAAGSTWDVIYPGTSAAAHEHYFLVYPGADQIQFRIQSYSTVNGFKAELATEAEAKAWSDAVWAEMNVDDPIANDGSKIFDNVLKDFPIPADPFAKLPKLKAALTNGVPFTIHFLGDSIAQDTYFSLVTAQLRAKFPKADLRFTLYEEDSTGCSVFKDKLSTAIPYTPDLLIICGLDNFRGTGYTGDDAAAAALKTVIEYAKGLGSEVLYMTPAHSADSRLLQNSNLLYSESGTGWGAPWGDACTPAVFNPANNDFWTSECYHPTARNAALAEEDVPLWDIYPQCYDFVERSGRPWGWFNRDCLHNNERGRALIAHLLMAYFDKAGVEGEGEGEGEEPVAPPYANMVTVVDGDGNAVEPVRISGDNETGGELYFMFTDTTKTYTFTPQKDLTVRLLVVAGGGAGGSSPKGPAGGGGAGGMIERTLDLTADQPYAIQVGAGGVVNVSQDAATCNGKDSAFGDIVATGGGCGGGNAWGGGGSGVGKKGGSGGGSQYHTNNSSVRNNGGAGIPDQGNSGGSITVKPSKILGTGGGGAGAPAIDITSDNLFLTHGGDGLPSDITGTTVWYAGGGAGVCCSVAKGGKGGGGNEGYVGTDGLGGGGSGYKNGGSGVVIVRFSDVTGPKPKLERVGVTPVSSRSADVAFTVAGIGEDAASADVKVEFWIKGDTEKSVAALATVTAAGSYAATLIGLIRETTYSYRVFAENDAGQVSDDSTGEFTMFDASLNAEATGVFEKKEIGSSDTAFIFTGNGTFTPSGSGIARVLVVGGGGAGGSWCGGGGGAGGLLYDSKFFFEKGVEYAIAVGAGGVGVSGMTQGAKGKDSTITHIVNEDTVTDFCAFGGGGGGNRDNGGYNLPNMSGGSGGGGGGKNNGLGGAGTEGQGFDGGVTFSASTYAAGGGGAGGAGSSGVSGKAGDGGPGLSYDISGETVVYAAGGGGGVCDGSDISTIGVGGSGIGGSGQFNTGSAATAPTGYGCGGGGGGGRAAGGNSGGTASSGTAGIVIIRYTDYEAAEKDHTPQASLNTLGNITANSVDIPVDISVVGGTADTLTITALYGYSADDLKFTNVLSTAASGSATYTLGGLSPNRTYFIRLVLDNGLVDEQGAKDGVLTLDCDPITTAEAFTDKSVSFSRSGTTGKFTCTLAIANAEIDGEDSRLELWFGASVDTLAKASEQSVAAAGVQTISYLIPKDDLTRTFYYRIRYVGTDGASEWVNETAVYNTLINDGSTYQWKKEVTDGYWDDPDCWTMTGSGVGFPITGSGVTFAGVSCATVHVAGVYSINGIRYAMANNGTLVFTGEVANAAVNLTGSPNHGSMSSGQKVYWYRIKTNSASTNWGTGSAAELHALDGANVTLQSATVSADRLLEVAGGAALSSGNTTCAEGARIKVDNGTLKPANLTASGAATIDVNVPAEGFETAPIVCSGAVATSGGGVFRVNIPKTCGIRATRKRCDIPLMKATSIPAAAVTARKLPTNNSSLVLKDASGNDCAPGAAGVSLWLRYAPPTGLAIILR